MKRIFCFLLAVCMLISLTGCSVPQAPQDSQTSQDGTTIQWAADEYTNAEKMAQKIIKCLIEKDQEGLSALFCKPISSSASFSPSIGCIYSKFNYDSYVGYRCDDMVSSYSKKDGNEILRTLQARIIYIEVPETGANGEEVSKFYGLEWYWVLTCEDNPELVGIHQLTLRLLNTDQVVTVGNLNYWP